MPNLIDIITSTYPANSDAGVPLGTVITILFSKAMDETFLEEQFFLEGPDTDTFIGPGAGLLLEYPDNISQGDEFLTSPGLRGMVAGTYEFKKMDPNNTAVEVLIEPYVTKMLFTPSRAMASLLEYTAHLPEGLDTDAVSYTGHVTFSFTTGSGSIQEIPSTASTSVLNALSSNSPLLALTPMEIVTLKPDDRSVRNNPDKLKQIEVEFNKIIDASSVDNTKVSVTVLPAIEHPYVSVTTNENIATSVSVSNKKLIIKI